MNDKIKKDLVGIFENRDWEYDVKGLIDGLKEKGYDNIGKILTEVLTEGEIVINANEIEDDGTVWFVLTWPGASIWDKNFKGKEGYSDDSIYNS